MFMHFIQARLSRVALFALAACAWSGAACAAPAYTLQHFADDGIESPATFDDISDAGVVVGQQFHGTFGLARFANGVVTPIPHSEEGYIAHINAKGDVSADVITTDHNYVGIWWADGSETLITELSTTPGMNSLGQLIGQEAEKTQQVGIWDNGVYRRLTPLDGHPGSVVTAINYPGVVVGYTNGVSPRPVQWNANGKVHRLGSDAEVGIGQAVDINNAGHIIGCTDVLGCFLKKGHKFKKLPSANGHKVNSVKALSEDDVVLAYTYSHTFRADVLYCNGTSYLFQDLLGEEGSHWTSLALNAMNGSATIAGHGLRDGVPRNFIATLTTPCN